MIVFPNAKINIGLEVIRKREDGFHDLETIFYPVSLSDILEMNEARTTKLTLTGFDIDDNQDNNIVLKAYRLLHKEYNLPPVEFHLHKQVPTGAGLGGGSSDAAFTLMGLNDLFSLTIEKQKIVEFASQLGSDCAFFVHNYPLFAEGRGTVFSEIELDIKGHSLVLIKPPFPVSTAEAYKGITPIATERSLPYSVKKPISEWKNCVFNRFEENVFNLYPKLDEIKKSLYSKGALYASMSGSGSTVYGIFDTAPQQLKALFPDCFYWEEKI
jgi:4-diphosphocytidyl-2-C-methyl-D-erythritol kinase